MNKQLTQFSKLLSFILRHNPGQFNLHPSADGWVCVNDLIQAVQKKHPTFNKTILEKIVLNNDKKRFSFNDNKNLIRSNQGHTIDINLGLEPCHPPTKLFHGSSSNFSHSISQEGLKKMKRHHVHLSKDKKGALQVARRRKAPIIYLVHAEEMWKKGFLFYCSTNEVWLTDWVPPEYLHLLK